MWSRAGFFATLEVERHSWRGVVFNYNVIKKIYITILVGLIWTLLIVLANAAEAPKLNETYSDQFIEAHNSPISPVIASNCVKWAKMYLGRENESWGIAGAIKPNADIPWPGYVVLLNEGEYGHLAIIVSIEGSKLHIIEANYIPNEVGTRVLDISDPRIRGYWY